MKLRIGISPCPNDTFIFDAIYSNQINNSPFEFEFIFEDVETLNELSIASEIDILKMSYANYFHVMDHYVMLRSGGALGNGVGPLLVAKNSIDAEQIPSLSIAIPGPKTTANFLLQFAYPSALNKLPMLFSEIENAVLEEKVDAGVIIHENRFTYQDKGLIKLLDLGEYWEHETSLPIPLGGIAIKRNFDTDIHKKINELIAESIKMSRAKYPKLSDFITCHAQEMSEEVMRKHIDLYVNDYSIDIGEKGKQAVEKMASVIGQTHQPLFI